MVLLLLISLSECLLSPLSWWQGPSDKNSQILVNYITLTCHVKQGSYKTLKILLQKPVLFEASQTFEPSYYFVAFKSVWASSYPVTLLSASIFGIILKYGHQTYAIWQHGEEEHFNGIVFLFLTFYYGWFQHIQR